MRTARRRRSSAWFWVVFAVAAVGATATVARAAGHPLVKAAEHATTTPDKPAAGTVDNAAAQSGILDAFGRTRLFQMAEGKSTTNLREMLQPAFWVDTIKELVVAAIAFVPRLLVSVLFLFVFWLIYRALRRVVVGAMNKANLDESIRDLLVTCLKWTVMGFGVVIACNQIGIPIVAMLTGVSILGLAVGFAAQETLANFIAGVVIFWDKPFRAGDWLTIEDTFAKVERITFRSCRLLDENGSTVILPNTTMLAKRVANHSAHPLSRISVAVPLGKCPLAAARRALLATVAGDERICQSPRPEVVLGECTEANTPVVLRFWVEDESQEQSMKAEYREKAKSAVDETAAAAAAVTLRAA